MPLSRDPRMDRRKRILRESLPADDEVATGTVARARSRRISDTDEGSEEPLRKRGASYSQDVRRACQHRLVQLIPVRRRAYLVAVFASCLIPAILLVAHYWVYVNRYLNWYGHPLAVLLDASHPRGIAAWLSGQVWLLCLAATVLTFQLRRHKLDDYNGDYRLWFWLVSTCIIGSLDSTTRVIDVFGDALNRWSILNLGWTGPAVVQATLASLIGMLGVRLCSELKAVPTSLMFWLVGLVAWAGSAALGQEMLRLDMSIQFRIWLRSALWLSGLTAIWLSALSYLRYVYIEAQRRFLLRGRLAASVSSTWKERITESMPAMPAIPKFRLRRPAEEEGEPVEVSKKRRGKAAQEPLQTDASEQVAAPRRFGLPSFMKRKPAASTEPTSAAGSKTRSQDDRNQSREEQRATNQNTSNNQAASTGNGPLSQARRNESPSQTSSQTPSQSSAPRAPVSGAQQTGSMTGSATNSTATKQKQESEETAAPAARRSWLGRLVSKPKVSDEAPEYRKVEKAAKAAERAAEKLAAKNEKARLREEQRSKSSGKGNGSEAGDEKPRRGWLPKMSLPKMKMPSIPRPKLPKMSMPKLGLPKLKLPSLRLPPPDSSTPADGRVDNKQDARSLPASKPLPTTNGPASQALESSGGRPLSKAERKRLKRMQDDDDYEVEDRRAA